MNLKVEDYVQNIEIMKENERRRKLILDTPALTTDRSNENVPPGLAHLAEKMLDVSGEKKQRHHSNSKENENNKHPEEKDVIGMREEKGRKN